jgi:acetolactate synthase-1/2/3 large subunit
MTTVDSPRAVYTRLVEDLIRMDTTVMFGLAGEDTVAFITSAAQAGITYCGARHENIAVGMADGFSWRSGRVGVCTVTRGPGLLNAATAIRTAARARRRVLVITGDMATAGDWDWDFKSIEHDPLVAALGARHFRARTADDCASSLRDAMAAAVSGDTVVLSIPVDVMHSRSAEPATQVPAAAASAPPIRPAPRPGDLRRAAELLLASDRPLILAGRGAKGPEIRDALQELARRSGALLGTSLLARDQFLTSPYDIGVVGGFSGDPAVPVLATINCVVAFGASLNTWTTGGGTLFQDVPVIQVDTDPTQLGACLPVSLGVCGDALETARELIRMVPEPDPGHRYPLHEPELLQTLREPLWSGPDETSSEGLDPRAVTTALDAILPNDRAVILDSGRHLTSAGRFMRFLGPDAFRHTADGGAIGMGLGIALGATAARPETPTVLFIGDGGLSMTLGDLETAVRNQLGLIVVVMNDHAYGSEVAHLNARGLPWDYAQLPEIDFAQCARSLGVEAATIRTLGDLRAHARNLEGRTSPLLLDCKIRQDLFVQRVTW